MIPINTPFNLTVKSILATSRNSILYIVSREEHLYVLKTSWFPTNQEKEAFEDEFCVMSKLSHPALPTYYSFYESLQLDGMPCAAPAILMEYIEGIPMSFVTHLTTSELKKYILDLGDLLFNLLEHGVLYMDLHPNNTLIEKDRLRVIDFTKAYYYRRNPNPSYIPKISYQLNQNLLGQQILIQAITYYILHLPENMPTETFPSHLKELGLHPHLGISFLEFMNRIEKEWET